ncbi:MAG TPA: RNA 2',3'-cyclic phosphodiesterase [Terracidiphilus sp.]|nr:RNA 2',3'-cyclic phosphodiesterase [Terracidiphilus sp.]
MRLFVAIPLASAVIDELRGISARLQTNGDGLRWSQPESWHVTLQFLGNTGPEQYDCTVSRLREVRFRPVPVVLEELGFFDRAGVFFAGVKLTPELLLLQNRVTEATEVCGFIPETRPYQPHITLARWKGNGQRQGLERLRAKIARQPQFTRFVAEEFLLFESFLGPGGSRYEVRERFSFDGR